MNFFAISALINLFTSISLCLAILLKHKRNALDIKFLYFSFSASVWSTGYFLWQISSNQPSALFWCRFFMVGAIGIGISYLHFIFEFLELRIKRKRLLLFADALFLLLLFLDFTPLMVKGVEARSFFPYWPVPGIAFPAFLFIWFAYISYSTYLLYKVYRAAIGVTKQQIKQLLWGVSIGFVAGSVNYLLWYNIPVPPITNILVSVYFILVFYAIVRYNFFNIKIITTEAFVFFLMITAIAWQFITPDNSIYIYVTIGFLALVISLGILLMKSVINEERQKEQLQNLTKELAEANEKLKALDQARAEFISIASHQLRTPPATIKWYLGAILSGDYGPLDEGVKKILLKTQTTNNLLISLIEDLLNVSRIERGKMEFLFEPLDVESLAQVTFEQLQPMAQEKGLELSFKKPLRKLPSIMADKEKLRQVMNNMIDNAIKYTRKGCVIVGLNLTDDNEIRFQVTDTGKGISSETIDSIFEKYTRGKNSVHESTGLGLGLYVAKAIIEQHKGKVWAESPGEGKGSTFIFTIPVNNDLKRTTLLDLTATEPKS